MNFLKENFLSFDKENMDNDTYPERLAQLVSVTPTMIQDALISLIRSGMLDINISLNDRKLVNRTLGVRMTKDQYNELLKNIDMRLIRQTQKNVDKIKKQLEKLSQKYTTKFENPTREVKNLLDDPFIERIINYDENTVKNYDNDLKKLLAQEKNFKRKQEKQQLITRAIELGFKGRKNASIDVLKEYIKKEEKALARMEKRQAKRAEKEEKIAKRRERQNGEVSRRAARKEYHVTITIFYWLYQGNEPRYLNHSETYILSSKDDAFIDAFVQETIENLHPGYETKIDYYTVDSLVAVRQRDVREIENQPLQGTVFTYHESFMDKTEQPEQNCVLEYLKKHFYKVAKKATDQTFLDIMGTTPDNITLKHIEKIADKYRVSFNALSLDNKIIKRYDFEGHADHRPNGHVDTMMFVVGNGHLYPITDKKIRKCIVERNKKDVQAHRSTSPDESKNSQGGLPSVERTIKVVKVFTNKILDEINPDENQVIISTQACEDLIDEARYLFQKDKMIYAISCEGRAVKSIKYKNTLLIANHDYQQANQLAEKLQIQGPIVSQNKTFLALKFFKERITIPDCNMSQNLEEAFNSDFSKVSAWTEHFVNKTAEECISMDVAKCDTYNLIFNKHPIIRNLEMIQDYKGEAIECGFYFLENECIYAGGGGWKSYILINKLLEEKLISKKDITKKIVAYEVWDGQNILPHVEELFKLVPEHAKEIINRFIGSMNKSKTIDETRGVITTGLFDAEILKQQYNNDGFKAFLFRLDADLSATTELFQISAFKHKLHPENKTLIYSNIVQARFVKIMEIIKSVLGFIPRTKQELIDLGVFAIKTDNVVFSTKHSEKIHKVVDEQVKVHPLFGYFRTEQVKRNLRQSTNTKFIRVGHFEERHTDNLTWDNEEIYEEKHPEIDYIAKLKGCFIEGLGGSGKSYLLKQLTEYFQKLDYDVKVLAHTNTAADNIKGQTLYKLLGISTVTKRASESKIKRLIKKQTVFIIDEVSLLTSTLFNILKDIKKSHGDKVKFYIAGDFKQCPAVEKHAEKIDYENNNILKELTHGNKIVLKTQYRSDAEFVQKCAKGNFEDIRTIKADTFHTRINICKTHKVRKQINDVLMKNESKVAKGNVIHIPMETLDMEKIIDGMIKSSKKADGEKGLSTDVDKEFIQGLFDTQTSCCYCKRTWACGDRKPTLERKDNKVGHIKTNCVLACRCCNETRRDRYTHEQFKTYINEDVIKTEDDRQEMWIYKGLPLIARKNYKKKEIINSRFYNTESVKNGIVCVKDMKYGNTIEFDLTKDSEINAFRDLFLPRYAMTVQKVQGQTITEPFTIHEWRGMNQKIKFTAATRTTNPANVFIIL